MNKLTIKSNNENILLILML